MGCFFNIKPMYQKNILIKYIYIISIIIFIITLDQITKSYILNNVSIHQNIEIIKSFLNINLLFNRGISFGIMDQTNNANTLFLVLNITITLIICYFTFKNTSLALALIVGGAIGNLIDRFKLGAVVDFIDLDIKIFYIGVFNIADVAITSGCMLVLAFSFITSKNDKKI